jgi:hypothetical protein
MTGVFLDNAMITKTMMSIPGPKRKLGVQKIQLLLELLIA